MATTHRTTKTKQKTQHGRAAGKLSTVTPGGSRHDYTKLIGIKVKDSVELVKRVEKGLPFSTVEALRQQMDLATKDMARLLDIKFTS